MLPLHAYLALNHPHCLHALTRCHTLRANSRHFEPHGLPPPPPTHTHAFGVRVCCLECAHTHFRLEWCGFLGCAGGSNRPPGGACWSPAARGLTRLLPQPTFARPWAVRLPPPPTPHTPTPPTLYIALSGPPTVALSRAGSSEAPTSASRGHCAKRWPAQLALLLWATRVHRLTPPWAVCLCPARPPVCAHVALNRAISLVVLVGATGPLKWRSVQLDRHMNARDSTPSSTGSSQSDVGTFCMCVYVCVCECVYVCVYILKHMLIPVRCGHFLRGRGGRG